MMYPQRENKALKWNFTPRVDCLEQVAHRGWAEALLFLKLNLGIAVFERKDVRGLDDPALLIEQSDLFLAEPLDINSPARHEVTQLLRTLIWAVGLSSAPRNHPLIARRRDVALDERVQRTRAFGREVVRLSPVSALFQNYAQ